MAFPRNTRVVRKHFVPGEQSRFDKVLRGVAGGDFLIFLQHILQDFASVKNGHNVDYQLRLAVVIRCSVELKEEKI